MFESGGEASLTRLTLPRKFHSIRSSEWGLFRPETLDFGDFGFALRRPGPEYFSAVPYHFRQLLGKPALTRLSTMC